MRDSNHSARLTAATLLALLLGTYLYSADANAAGEYRDISRINGRVQVEANEPVGNVSTINGRINIDHGASAGSVKTVNGGIDIAADAEVARLETVNGDIDVASSVMISGSASTVNGSIDVGRDVQVQGALTTVNGGVRLGAGSEVARDVRTANGQIRLYNSQVGEDVVTSNGDITLSDGSVVNGDVIYRNKRRWWNRLFSFGFNRDPMLSIDESSVVHGDIHLYHKVDLDIADGANIGEIIYHY